MKKPGTALTPRTAAPVDNSADALYAQIHDVLQQARRQAKRSINQTMVQAYWQVGKLIVEHEQGGEDRAAYGANTLQLLADRLGQEFGRGFSAPNLRNFRQFFLTYTQEEICYTPCSELGWSHFRLLMRVADPAARQWYAREAVSQTWSVAALDRQISTLYYQRLCFPLRPPVLTQIRLAWPGASGCRGMKLRQPIMQWRAAAGDHQRP